MVEDRELPFPESVAASEIHKAGRSGKSGAKFLFWAMGLGALIQILKQIQFFAAAWERFVPFMQKKIILNTNASVDVSGGALLSTPGVSPAYMGVGYIIGPALAALTLQVVCLHGDYLFRFCYTSWDLNFLLQCRHPELLKLLMKPGWVLQLMSGRLLYVRLLSAECL
jgi:hypothetical protein